MYSFDSRIRYSEINSQGFLTMEALMNYFQDCSTFQSEDSGIGLEYLGAQNEAWVVNSWQVDVMRFPKLCEHVTIGTIPYEIKGFIGNRNFFMKTDEGETLAQANSVWALINMETGAPVRVTQEIFDGYPIGDRLPMEYLPRKIPFPSEGEGRTAEDILVTQSHLDTNNHVNNNQYIRMALSCIGGSEDGIRRLRAEYKNQAHLGDTIKPVINYRTEEPKQIYTVSLKDTEGQPYCIVEVTM